MAGHHLRLVANYISMSGLLAAITEGLTGSGLARDNGVPY
jgi:hypothetical protein